MTWKFVNLESQFPSLLVSIKLRIEAHIYAKEEIILSNDCYKIPNNLVYNPLAFINSNCLMSSTLETFMFDLTIYIVRRINFNACLFTLSSYLNTRFLI